MSAIFGPLPALPTYWVTYFSQRGTIFSQDAGLWFCISLICCYLSEAGKKRRLIQWLYVSLRIVVGCDLLKICSVWSFSSE